MIGSRGNPLFSSFLAGGAVLFAVSSFLLSRKKRNNSSEELSLTEEEEGTAAEKKGSTPSPESQTRENGKNCVSYHPEGPRLSYLWSREKLTGQSLYLGGEEGCDKRIFCIPGHALQVLVIDTKTDEVYPIGPKLPGKFKWLRGVLNADKDVVYGLPCNSDTVLRIHVPTNTVTKIPIPYEEFYNNKEEAKHQRAMPWKYHGGSMLPTDGCIYAIPQSAWHVLKIDPETDTCTLVGPTLKGRCKWYGGVIGKQDHALYGIPQNASSVLRIDADPLSRVSSVTLHGDYGTGGHKWHGATAAPDGTIVSVPANADSVLLITPARPEPVLMLIGTKDVIRTGRHRTDRKYKFLGAMAGTDGKVYCFPCGSERVLQIDTVLKQVREVGPNLLDTQMERMLQNKWQNGLTSQTEECVYSIPLAADTVLRIDTKEEEPKVTTWKLPSPFNGLAKWEGGVIATNGIMYCMPNNHKAVLRIEPSFRGTTLSTKINQEPNTSDDVVVLVDKGYDQSKGTLDNSTASIREKQSAAKSQSQRGATSSMKTSKGLKMSGDAVVNKGSTQSNEKLDKSTAIIREKQSASENAIDLKYKTGIATLRGAAHTVKFSLKHRKHDPKPRGRDGKETNTTTLPSELCEDTILNFDGSMYDFRGTVAALLEKCDSEVVGQFPRNGSSSLRLEEFDVPPTSLKRKCQGGLVEEAQKYLSELVVSDAAFIELFDRFVTEVVLPDLKERLLRAEANPIDDEPVRFYYQRPPTLRLQPGPARAIVKAHHDAEYGHQNGELNFWLPLTNRDTGVDLWCESTKNAGDYRPLPAEYGEIVSFHGSSCRHYVNANHTKHTRVSLDFRVGVEGYFDPTWMMSGTKDDHTRRSVEI